ncbi:M16 family metallopeptidase [Marinobacter subterrani]|uniref:M16 family metallopeptidase n=1 Tax=Marinobacter subterrani TaxID=1658765 RepID=UPI00235462D9|nr:pitrilysin family protein [Marinobacter subterrani]
MLFACSTIATADQPSAQSLRVGASSGTYTAPDLYAPSYRQFENGLKFVSLKRDHAQNVTLKVRVGVGMSDFPCGSQETPHALEHMVYGGLPNISETELEKQFWELGIDSNAYVDRRKTVFEMQIFPESLYKGLSLTLRTLTESQFDDELWQSTQTVLHQEAGGEPTQLVRSASTGGKFASAYDRLAAAMDAQFNLQCPQFNQQQNVDLEKVQQAYNDFYRPGNMMWVVVGDFDEERLNEWARKNLASLSSVGAIPPRKRPNVTLPEQRRWKGFGPVASAGLGFQTDGLGSEDYFDLTLLSEILNQMAYTELRLKDSIAYSPSSWFGADEYSGTLLLSTDLPSGNHEEGLIRMHSLLDSLTSAPLDERELNQFKLGLLRSWAQIPESNTGFADYYIASFWEFENFGSLINYEAKIAAVTVESLHSLASSLKSSKSKFELINHEYPNHLY